MNPSLQNHYGAMWDRAFAAIAAGDIECDHRLAAGPDPRRGLTVIARPGPALAARFDALLDRLAAVAPGQYRHPAADMHLTVLSLFTVSDDPSFAMARLDDYRAAVRAAIHGIAAFEIAFRGITLSRGAVMACGFPRDGMLETLRERLRAQLRERGLDGTLDGRYRLVTAHSTLMRFAGPLQDPLRFARELEAWGEEPLGQMRVQEVELVVNDWYMSHQSLRLLETFPLT
jgi:2'-5' RNA ligase